MDSHTLLLMSLYIFGIIFENFKTNIIRSKLRYSGNRREKFFSFSGISIPVVNSEARGLGQRAIGTLQFSAWLCCSRTASRYSQIDRPLQKSFSSEHKIQCDCSVTCYYRHWQYECSHSHGDIVVSESDLEPTPDSTRA